MPFEAGTGFIDIRPDTSRFMAALQTQVGPALDRVGRGLSRAGRSLTRSVTLPLLGVAGASVKIAADFDQSMRNVNSIMKVSEDRLASFGLQVRKLSTEVPQTAGELADGLYNVASSGFAGAQAMDVLEVSAKAASAGMTDTETSSRAIIAVLNAYGLKAKDAARVSDVLFQGVNIGIETFPELANSIGTYIGAASQLKVPLEDVVGAQAAMTKTGINAAEAATALNGIFKTLLKPSEDLRDELKEMGFETGQAALESLGLQGVIEKLSEEVGNNKGKWVELFPEVRAARGAMALAANDGGLLDEVMRGMSESTDAAGKAFDEQSKGAAFRFGIALNELRDAGIELGNTLIPVLTEDIIPAIQSAVDWFSDLSPKTKEWGLKIAGVALVLGPFLSILGPFVRLLGGASRVLPGVVGWLLKWSKIPGFPVGTVPTTGPMGRPGGGAPTPVPGGRGRTTNIPPVGVIAGAYGLGSIGTVRVAEGLEKVNMEIRDWIANVDVADQTLRGMQPTVDILNQHLKIEGSNLRVNAELFYAAVRGGLTYEQALQRQLAGHTRVHRGLKADFIPAMQRSAEATGKAKEKADDLKGAIDLIPTTRQFTLRAETTEAQRQIDDVLRALREIANLVASGIVDLGGSVVDFGGSGTATGGRGSGQGRAGVRDRPIELRVNLDGNEVARVVTRHQERNRALRGA